jgi:ribosomal protein S18 acetylase RimI-like enzyme
MSSRQDAVVRRIRADEGARLRDIRLRALADAPDAFGSTYSDTVTRPPEMWTARAAENAAGEVSVLFVAEKDEQCVGLAGRLLDAVMAWARDRGAERVHLWVTEGNSPAIALYERFGFAFTGESAPVRSDSALKELKMVLPSTLPRE